MDKEQLGQRIKEIRMKKGLKQDEFGKLINDATKSMVSKWERGITSPSSDRQKVLIELGESVGVTLFPSNDLEELQKFIEREYSDVYDEYIKLQLRESGDRFRRLLDITDKDSLKVEAVNHVLSRSLEERLSPDQIEEQLYDYLNVRFNEMLLEFPQSDLEVIDVLTHNIQLMEENLQSYYYDSDGEWFNDENLDMNNYHRIRNILEFTKFQLQNLRNK